MTIEAIGDLVQSRHYRTIILAAKLHHVDGVRAEFYPIHHIMVEWVAAQSITIPKAVQQPLRKIVHRISPSSSVEYHAYNANFFL